MSIRKILVDFSEYERLLQIEKHYEELLKETKEEKVGKGDISLILAEKKTRDALEAPLPKEIGSITVPPNAVFEEEVSPSKKPSTGKFVFDKWYDIGDPF